MVIGNRYEVVRKFEGGMGVAYVCNDLNELDKYVVLKTYKGSWNQQFREALIREANAWIELHGQQYLARIDDVLSMDGRIYLKMPYYANGSLADLIGKGSLSLESAVTLSAQILMGMRYLSDKSHFLHLDLKPQNILIGDDGEALITDLGLAKCFSQRKSRLTDLQSKEESGNSGTLPYMAPELFKGEKASVSADIWAWGVIFLEMMTGVRAFRGANPESLVKSICFDFPRGWLEIKESVPRAVFGILEKVLHKDTDKRPGSFEELSKEFDKIIKTGFGDARAPFWKKDERVALSDDVTASHWVCDVRNAAGGLKASIKYSELTELERAKRYRAIGDRSSSLSSLKKLLGGDDLWALNWADLMRSRSSGSMHVTRNGVGLDVFLGRDKLIEAAELRMAVFLDGLYDKKRVSGKEIESYCLASIQIKEVGLVSAKLYELCGQVFLQVKNFDLAEGFLLLAWGEAKGNVKISSAACIATLYGVKGSLHRLKDFAVNEIEPMLSELDDPKAQETCARPYLFLKDPERALHFLRRSLSMDKDNPWGLMQACVSAWNCGHHAEAKRWRHVLSNIDAGSSLVEQIDQAIPQLRG